MEFVPGNSSNYSKTCAEFHILSQIRGFRNQLIFTWPALMGLLAVHSRNLLINKQVLRFVILTTPATF